MATDDLNELVDHVLENIENWDHLVSRGINGDEMAAREVLVGYWPLLSEAFVRLVSTSEMLAESVNDLIAKLPTDVIKDLFPDQT